MQSKGQEMEDSSEEWNLSEKALQEIKSWLKCEKCQELGIVCRPTCVKRSWREIIEVNKLVREKND